MNYEKIFNELISDFDLELESEQKKAHEKCFKYAKENITKSSDFNSFMAIASERLGQVAIRKDIIKASINGDGTEKLHLTYAKGVGPTLTGNKTGLSYLSKVLSELSQTGYSAGEHVHFHYLYCLILLKNSKSFIRLTFQGNGPHGKVEQWSDDLRYKNGKFLRKLISSHRFSTVC